MAAQGQTVFAASGDYGAYDPYTGTVAVQDPASQPYVCGVGGTTLSTNSDGSYNSETTWGGSGGGYSTLWNIPSYQASVVSVLGDGWAAYYLRNVPDVSLNADPNVGYDEYNSTSLGGWDPVGGTSAAAPLWSALVALANQERKNYALGRVGFINPDLYNLFDEGYYFDMFDIQTGNNGVYNATYYYDAATGLGSYDGNQLLYELAQSPTEVAWPLPPASATATKVTNTSVKIAWTKSLGAKDYIIYRTPANDDPPQIAMTKNLNYTDTSVHHGTSYYYWIKAINAGGYASSYVFTNTVTP
jgi:subtilase family serine protease